MKAVKILKMFLAGYAPEDEDIEEALKELGLVGDIILEKEEALDVLAYKLKECENMRK